MLTYSTIFHSLAIHSVAHSASVLLFGMHFIFGIMRCYCCCCFNLLHCGNDNVSECICRCGHQLRNPLRKWQQQQKHRQTGTTNHWNRWRQQKNLLPTKINNNNNDKISMKGVQVYFGEMLIFMHNPNGGESETPSCNRDELKKKVFDITKKQRISV